MFDKFDHKTELLTGIIGLPNPVDPDGPHSIVEPLIPVDPIGPHPTVEPVIPVQPIDPENCVADVWEALPSGELIVVRKNVCGPSRT